MLKQKEWLEAIIGKTGCSKKEAKIYYDCIFDSLKESLDLDNPIKISGIGVFKIRKTAAKEQVNLISGNLEVVPEHNVIRFRPYLEIDPKPDPIIVEDEDNLLPIENEQKIVENFDEVKEQDDIVLENKEEYIWIYQQEQMDTNKIIELIQQKTALPLQDVQTSIDIIIQNMKANNKNTCEIKECEDKFDFIIYK